MMSSRSSRFGTQFQTVCGLAMILTVMFLWNKVSTQRTVIQNIEMQLHKQIIDSVPIDLGEERIQIKPIPVQNIQSTKTKESEDIKQQSTLPTLPSMYEIGMKTGTDKVTHHGYDRYYPFFLEHLRNKPNFKMLEIGFLLGQSYQMWLEYFPLAKVFFMDKDCAQTFPEARFCGDQGKTEDLKRLLREKGVEKGGLDFIIDDGSHHPLHQITSFKFLFEHGLKPGESCD